jgi:calcium binding protein 39
MSAEFLDNNYDRFFSHYQNLLNSDNYVTRRQALKVILCTALIITTAIITSIVTTIAITKIMINGGGVPYFA